MLKKLTFYCFIFLWTLFVSAGFVFADGIIIPDPVPGVIEKPNPLSVQYHRVTVDINNQVATTSIDQVFKNDYPTDLEGTYIFPLPDDASISSFSMYINGKETEGEILDKDKARQIYEDIVRRMKDPGLLEYMGRNIFRARVYPIPKNGEKRIKLIYQETLKYDAGMVQYVYPLDTEKFSPTPLEEVTISVRIKSNTPIKTIYSPSHKIDKKLGEYEATCGYEEKNVKPDKEFVLYYTVAETDMGLNLLTYRKSQEDGYFLLMLSPGELKKENLVINKDLTFVLDTSGSMNGKKIAQAKEALRYCINNLNKGDRFNLISFATEINLLKDNLVPANDKNIKDALDFITNLRARGGTNINEALISALQKKPDEKRPHMIVFITDGEPTVGVTDINELTENIAKANKTNARIFVFGVGYDVNTHLLERIAQDNSGVTEYVKPDTAEGTGEDIEIKVSRFYEKISEPILADVNIDFGKIKMKELYPKDFPDIFKGTQLILLGRYQGDGSTAITLKGQVSGKEKKFVYEGKFPKVMDENVFIPRLWATRKVGYLMNEIRLKGENKEIKDEIISLSKEFGIMTPYTSFLILEDEKDYERWGITQSAVPHLKSAGNQFGKAMREDKGVDSISAGSEISKLKKEGVITKSQLDTVRHIGAKTFYLREGGWVDNEFKEEMKLIKVEYLSKEYFSILKQEPALGKFFSLGENVTVVFEGKCYQVVR